MLMHFQQTEFHTGASFDLLALASLERCYLLGEFLRHSGYVDFECLSVLHDSVRRTWLHKEGLVLDMRFSNEIDSTLTESVSLFWLKDRIATIVDTCPANWRHLPLDRWNEFEKIYVAMIQQGWSA
ncbi:MAG: hypothetical protein U0892_10730 [Pirellulales bacterium]